MQRLQAAGLGGRIAGLPGGQFLHDGGEGVAPAGVHDARRIEPGAAGLAYVVIGAEQQDVEHRLGAGQ